jgi:chemotaxis protein methyltransferase CheR
MELDGLSEHDFHQFRKLIYSLTGIALSSEKRQLVQSRVTRRLRSKGMTSFSDYYAYVTGGSCPAEEIEALINCVTTNTTSFFREPHHFDFVRDQIIPSLLENQSGNWTPTLRIWHAGCSTGEEPYTLAITLAEYLNKHGSAFRYRQLATDIDTNALSWLNKGSTMKNGFSESLKTNSRWRS